MWIIIYWLVTRTVWIIIYWLVDGLKVCIDSNRVLQTDMVERLVYDHERKKKTLTICVYL